MIYLIRLSANHKFFNTAKTSAFPFKGPNNLYYLMMELATGVDLGDLIRMQHTGQLEEKRAKTFTRQFASALAHMHNLGVVHR